MTMFQIVLTKLISTVLAVVFIPFSILTHGIDLFTSGGHTDTAKTNVVGLGAIFRSQGMTTDGETYYFSSKTTLIRTKPDATTVIDADYSAIPEELKELGIAHIGGLSYYNGYIYAGMEDSKVWDYPIVGVFDAETLDFVDYYILDCETVTRGLPWVCVDPATGYLYCTDHSKQPTKLLVYDTANEMAFVKEIPLSFSVPSIQGAEFYNGILYAATNDETKAIYKINPDSGEVEKHLDRNLVGGEGEGMTFIEKDGKTVLVAMDMGTIFINAFIREYPV